MAFGPITWEFLLGRLTFLQTLQSICDVNSKVRPIHFPTFQFLSSKKWRIFFETLGPRERVFVFFLIVVFSVGILSWFAVLFFSLTKPVPAEGGAYTEGVVGEPAYINPALSQITDADADADLIQLVYSGLFGYDDHGKIQPLLAEKYDVVEDGKKYTVVLRSGVKWHDGENLTADDVVFTVRLIQDPAYKSPLRANWQGVEVSKEADNRISFSLKKPYFDFLENLTVGILPKHSWEGVSPEKFALNDLNLRPVGSGPFRVEGFKKDSNGDILSYELRAFPDYFEGAPFLQKVTLFFYHGEEELVSAYNRREILGMSNISPEKWSQFEGKQRVVLHQAMQPRVFAVFLNEKKSIPIASEQVRRALAFATDREALVRDIFLGFGSPAYSLFSPGMDAYSSAGEEYRFDLDKSKKLLDDAGWTPGSDGVREKSGTRLEFDLETPNWPEIVKSANLVAEQWGRVGARVSVKVLDTISDAQRTIRSREYQSLLYGLATTSDPDPYSFWHSEQSGESGYNFSLFSDKRADELLTDARETIDAGARSGMYREFQGILAAKMPSVFLYSPKYLYVVDDSVRGFSVETMNTPASRFRGISKWYMNTRRVRK